MQSYRDQNTHLSFPFVFARSHQGAIAAYEGKGFVSSHMMWLARHEPLASLQRSGNTGKCRHSAHLLSKTPAGHARLYEAQLFVQASCVHVAGYHGIELQNAKAVRFALSRAVLYQLFPDVPPPSLRTDGIACITDVPTPAYAVGV